MQIQIILDVITNIWSEDSEILAKTYQKKITPEELEGCSFSPNNYEVEGCEEVETTQLELSSGKSFEINVSCEEFEYTLSQIGLISNEIQRDNVIDLFDYKQAA